MSYYLAEFLTHGIGTYFKIMLIGFTDPLVSLFSLIGAATAFLVFIVLPYALDRFVVEKESKIKRRWVIIIDIAIIVFFAFLGASSFNTYSGMMQGLSANGGFYGTVYRGLVNYREYIGLLCGFILSVLINNKLLNKYLVKLRIDKYKKSIFGALFVLLLFVSHYFYYLCRVV